jgi:hypothetical protein
MMDAQRQAIFANQLHATMAGLTISQADPKFQAIIGSVTDRLLTKSSTNSWSDFKRRIDTSGYDQTLQAFQQGVDDMRRKQQPLGVRAMELMGVALIARYQTDPKLSSVISMLDTYIEQCATAFKKVSAARGKRPVAIDQ